MNFTAILGLLQYLPKILSFLPTVQKVIARGFSINAIKDDISDPTVTDFFKGIGAQFFPSVSDDLQVAAGASTVAPDYVMKVQNLINQVMPPTPALDVDGHYGAKTKAAIKAYQQSRGLVIDEWAGDVTMASLQADAVKMAPAKAA